MWRSKPNHDIRLLMFENEITFRCLANETGVSVSTLHRWLGHPMSPHHTERIMKALNRITTGRSNNV